TYTPGVVRTEKGDMVSVDRERVRQQYMEATADTTTDSGLQLKAVYTQDDMEGMDLSRDLGLPGEFPYTRGHHPQMYRGKLWNIRQITGLSTPKEYNHRLRMEIAEGAGALTYHVDELADYGLEPDQPSAEGMIGVTGVTSNHLGDVETALEGLPLDTVSLCPACTSPLISQSILLTGKRRGYDISQLRLVHGAFVMWLPMCYRSLTEVTFANGRISSLGKWGLDYCEYILRHLPKVNIWYFDGASAHEGGGSAIQEMAFILACRNDLLRQMAERGLDPAMVARALSPTVALGQDFFENIAKVRALRRLWAKTLAEDFGVSDRQALALRVHANVVGSLCTRQQPLVNLSRVSIAALSGVLAGVMGLQLACYDEAFATPTEEAVKLAIRTQQVLRYESGAARVADPLGGSFFMEQLTNQLEEEAAALLADMEERGGWLKLLENGWVHDVMRKRSWEVQQEIETGQRVVVGVNRFAVPPEQDTPPPIFSPGGDEVEKYLQQYLSFKEDRDLTHVKEALDALGTAAQKGSHLVEPAGRAMEAGATFAEVVGTLRLADGLEYDWAAERRSPW
ncbi:MAG: acyl-CoA mutase large subunit family protein, partial [Dehalococcoidia bacterium]|nr:acyl-CoA mutase large subunit family protein [Dehalococcoidia bacterium]